MKKVLVVDDEPLFRALLSEFLDSMGCEVFQANDGVEGVETFEMERPDCVFLDIRMPRKDGIQALKEIKEIDPEALVVVITASPKEGIRDAALARGVFDYLSKPVTPEMLEEIVERIKRSESFKRLED